MIFGLLLVVLSVLLPVGSAVFTPMTDDEFFYAVDDHLSGNNMHGPIGDWDTSFVTDMAGTFYYASSFNDDISGWDVSSVTDMTSMFQGASSFNQDLSEWDVSNVQNMMDIFDGATSFSQQMCWDLNPSVTLSSVIGYGINPGAAGSSFNETSGGCDCPRGEFQSTASGPGPRGTCMATPPPTPSPTTKNPTPSPTASPTLSPTGSPTLSPTESPTLSPTLVPTMFPTKSPTLSPTESPTLSPTLVPTLFPTESPTVSPTATPTTFLTSGPTGNHSSYNPHHVIFGVETSGCSRRNRRLWSCDGFAVCPDISVIRPGVLSMTTIVQSPSEDYMNMIVGLKHAKGSITPELTFIKLTIKDGDGNVRFTKEQKLFEESPMLTHLWTPLNSDLVVKEALKVGLQVKFSSEGIAPGLHYDVIVEIGVMKAAAGSDEFRVYDCVVVNNIGSK